MTCEICQGPNGRELRNGAIACDECRGAILDFFIGLKGACSPECRACADPPGITEECEGTLVQ